MHILFETFLAILLIYRSFSLRHFVLFYLLDDIARPFISHLKIQAHRPGTREALTKVICLSILQALFLLFCHFQMNPNTP